RALRTGCALWSGRSCGALGAFTSGQQDGGGEGDNDAQSTHKDAPRVFRARMTSFQSANDQLANAAACHRFCTERKRKPQAACLLRGTHPVQAFFTIRKREEFFFSESALATLIHQRRLTPLCGGQAPTAERTVGPARMIAESLTPKPGIRKHNRHTASFCCSAPVR